MAPAERYIYSRHRIGRLGLHRERHIFNVAPTKLELFFGNSSYKYAFLTELPPIEVLQKEKYKPDLLSNETLIPSQMIIPVIRFKKFIGRIKRRYIKS